MECIVQTVQHSGSRIGVCVIIADQINICVNSFLNHDKKVHAQDRDPHFLQHILGGIMYKYIYYI